VAKDIGEISIKRHENSRRSNRRFSISPVFSSRDPNFSQTHHRNPRSRAILHCSSERFSSNKKVTEPKPLRPPSPALHIDGGGALISINAAAAAVLMIHPDLLSGF
jgi:hypothetical protein